MGQEQFEAARTLGFEIRDPQRFAHNMARLVEEAGKAAAVFMQPYAINPTRFTLHDDLAPALGTLAQLQRAWLQTARQGVGGPVHSGTAVSTCGIPRCAGSWDWRTEREGPSAISLPKIPGSSIRPGQRSLSSTC